MVEQEAAIQGMRMSRRVEPILVTRQEIIILPRVEPTIAILERTWKQTRNETFKVHEMKQLY